MPKRKAKRPCPVIAEPVHGATPKDVTVTLKGNEYHLRFDYRALEVAEMKLAAEGYNVNMLSMINPQTVGANRLPFLFFASLVTLQPEITFAAAKPLVNFRTSMAVQGAVMDAYMEGMKRDQEPDPTPEPAAAK